MRVSFLSHGMYSSTEDWESDMWREFGGKATRPWITSYWKIRRWKMSCKSVSCRYAHSEGVTSPSTQNGSSIRTIDLANLASPCSQPSSETTLHLCSHSTFNLAVRFQVTIPVELYDTVWKDWLNRILSLAQLNNNKLCYIHVYIAYNKHVCAWLWIVSFSTDCSCTLYIVMIV